MTVDQQILEALRTGGGMLWKALWALIFGYVISGAIQVLVTREQMARALGERGAKQTGLASFFGFISSSCSFAALAASRSVLVKGAHPVNALAFLIASTNWSSSLASCFSSSWAGIFSPAISCSGSS